MPLGVSPPHYSGPIRLFGSPLCPNLPLRASSAAPFGLLGPPGRKLFFYFTLTLHAPRRIPPHYSEPFCLLGALCVPIYPFGPPQPHLASSGLLAPGKGTFLLFRLIEPQCRSGIRSKERIKSFQSTFLID